MASSARDRWGARALLTLCLLAPAPTDAQDTREVRGVVERVVDSATTRPVAGAWVVLHRVGRDAQGAIDSLRTGGDGRYRFDYRMQGDTGAVYFASTVYAGVAYFTSPLREPRVEGDAARLLVFDTASVDIPVVTRGRHLIISALDTVRQRTVIEVFEIENTTSRTRVANERAPSWSARLPAGATDVRVGDGAIPPDASAIADGLVQVFPPISPGMLQLSFSYLLPERAFPWTLPITEPSDVVEVLVEEPEATVSGASLEAQAAVMLDGRGFQRFLAQDVPGGAVVTVTVPAQRIPLRTIYVVGIVGIIGLGLLMGLARSVLRPGVPTFTRRGHSVDPAEAIAARIAALDAKFERLQAPSADERAQWSADREALKQQLSDILAERDNQL